MKYPVFYSDDALYQKSYWSARATHFERYQDLVSKTSWEIDSEEGEE